MRFLQHADQELSNGISNVGKRSLFIKLGKSPGNLELKRFDWLYFADYDSRPPMYQACGLEAPTSPPSTTPPPPTTSVEEIIGGKL